MKYTCAQCSQDTDEHGAHLNTGNVACLQPARGLGGDLVRDLAIVLAGPTDTDLTASMFMARRRVRQALGLLESDTLETADATLRAALDGRPQPERREIIWRREVQPGLSVLVEDSTNVLLELSTPRGQVLGRSEPLNDEHLRASITLARVAAEQNRDDAEELRMAGLAEAQHARRLAEPRDGEDAPSRAQATAQLVALGLFRYGAEAVLRRAYGHLSATATEDTRLLATVDYSREDGTYSVRVPEVPGVPVLRLSPALSPQVRAGLVALGAEFGRPGTSWIDDALSTARQYGRAELANPPGVVRAVLVYRDEAYELVRMTEQHARHQRWQDDTLARLSKDDDQR